MTAKDTDNVGGLISALEESNALLVAILVEPRDHAEIKRQISENREAIELCRAAPAGGVRVDGEMFICYLIDKCERETVTEESLHEWLADFLKNPRYHKPDSAPAGGDPAPSHHCQNGRADVCIAGHYDGVCCPDDSCDIDDGVRDPRPDSAPAGSGEVVTDAMVERAMNASIPGGSTAWVWLFNCEGGMRPEQKHRDWFRRVLEAALLRKLQQGADEVEALERNLVDAMNQIHRLDQSRQRWADRAVKIRRVYIEYRDMLSFMLENHATVETDGMGNWRVAYEWTSPPTYGPYAAGRYPAIEAAMIAASQDQEGE